MDLKKMLVFLVAAMFLAAPAFAGNIPEFDAVDCDATNYFAVHADIPYGLVIDNNIASTAQGDIKINQYSDFSGVTAAYDLKKMEFFDTNATQLKPDACFVDYLSSKSPVWTRNWFEWRITLQMQPESDIDLNIVDCVLKENETNIWRYAQQTGRFRFSFGLNVFSPLSNPRVSVVAIPGPNADAGFTAPFYLDARSMPWLLPVPLCNALYTSKAIFEEGLVMRMPTNLPNTLGQRQYYLKGGDMIDVKVEVPQISTVDMWYGPDNVLLKYIGILDTEYVTSTACATDVPVPPIPSS